MSANSTKANLYSVALVNGAPFPEGVLLKELRTIPVVANFLGCDEKTVRRALKANNIVKGK